MAKILTIENDGKNFILENLISGNLTKAILVDDNYYLDDIISNPNYSASGRLDFITLDWGSISNGSVEVLNKPQDGNALSFPIKRNNTHQKLALCNNSNKCLLLINYGNITNTKITSRTLNNLSLAIE